MRIITLLMLLALAGCETAADLVLGPDDPCQRAQRLERGSPAWQQAVTECLAQRETRR